MSILRVNEIQHSNGTAALTIDSSGRVLKSNIPAFYAFNPTSAVSVAAGAVIPLTSIILDNMNNYDSANSRFIAPVSGLYYFMTNLMTNNDAAYSGDHRLYVNGSQTSPQTAGYGFQANLASSSFRKAHLTAILNLNASDYVDVRPATTQTWYGAGTPHCAWTGYLMG